MLSGGACLGAAQAGMLEALYERKVHPDLLIGTSVGAINAAFAASRPASVATAIELQRLWRSMNRSRVFPVNPISVGLGFLGTLDHSVPVGALRRLVDSHLGFGRLEDAPVALHASPPMSSAARRSGSRAGTHSTRCWPARPFPASFRRCGGETAC